MSDKNWFVTFVLCFMLGWFGAHRFYVGKIGTGVLQLLTLGGLGWWMFYDLFVIVRGKFRDAQGMRILRPDEAAEH
jgi:TM2 domain-containing membrane protein YozV